MGRIIIRRAEPDDAEGIARVCAEGWRDTYAGAREQWVSVEPENAKGLPFYEARGFEARGERPAWGSAPEEGRVSLRLMRRLDNLRQQSIPQ